MQSILQQISVGIVDAPGRIGGRKVFVRNFCRMLHRLGYLARVIDIGSVSVPELNNFDVLHFSDTLQIAMHFWKIILARRPVKILTIHGWVIEETIFSLKEKKNLRETLVRFSYLITWIAFVKPIAMNFLLDAVTCPSHNTAKKNKLKKAIIIKNSIFPETMKKIKAVDIRSQPDEVVFATYVSIGGIKIDFLPKLVRVITKINEKINDRKVILVVFGKLSNRYATKQRSPHVRIMGFSEEFLDILKASDLFLIGASFSELGFSAIEAGALGIPIAKFTDAGSYEEELLDGQNAILAFTENDMIDKLLIYVSDLPRNKQRMGNALRQYFLKTRNWQIIAKYWIILFDTLLSTKRKES